MFWSGRGLRRRGIFLGLRIRSKLFPRRIRWRFPIAPGFGRARSTDLGEPQMHADEVLRTARWDGRGNQPRESPPDGRKTRNSEFLQKGTKGTKKRLRSLLLPSG